MRHKLSLSLTFSAFYVGMDILKRQLSLEPANSPAVAALASCIKDFGGTELALYCVHQLLCNWEEFSWHCTPNTYECWHILKPSCLILQQLMKPHSCMSSHCPWRHASLVTSSTWYIFWRLVVFTIKLVVDAIAILWFFPWLTMLAFLSHGNGNCLYHTCHRPCLTTCSSSCHKLDTLL